MSQCTPIPGAKKFYTGKYEEVSPKDKKPDQDCFRSSYQIDAECIDESGKKSIIPISGTDTFCAPRKTNDFVPKSSPKK